MRLDVTRRARLGALWFLAARLLEASPARAAGLVFAVAFSTLLTAHQLSMFVGILRRTSSLADDVEDADVWVMDPTTRYLDEVEPLPEAALARVRGVEGVAWAAPLSVETVPVRVPGGADGGRFQLAFLLGVDDESLAGAPRRWLSGDPSALRAPDAVAVDDLGAAALWPAGAPPGATFEVGGRRAVLAGVCRRSPTFQTLPVLTARRSVARGRVDPRGRGPSFVLVRAVAGLPLEALRARLERATPYRALTRAGLAWATHRHYLEHTGIPANFGITVSLAVVVGVVVAGQTFYLFTLEHLRHYALLAAVGHPPGELATVVLLQAAVVAGLGLSLGLGGAALFFEATAEVPALRGFFLPWQVAALTALTVLGIAGAASLASLRRLGAVDPAELLRGGP